MVGARLFKNGTWRISIQQLINAILINTTLYCSNLKEMRPWLHKSIHSKCNTATSSYICMSYCANGNYRRNL